MNGDRTTLEVFLLGTIAFGFIPIASDSRRAIEVLNDHHEQLQLSSVRLTDWQGQTLALIPSLSIEKSRILVTFTHESDEDQQQRRQRSFGLTKRTVVPTEIVAAVPFMVVTGTAYSPPGVGRQGLNLAAFDRFFAVTRVTMRPTGAPVRAAEFAIINRDVVVGLGELNPGPTSASTSAPLGRSAG